MSKYLPVGPSLVLDSSRTWSAMLKTTKGKLHMVSDYDMILMLTKGIRGGLYQCPNHHAVANNPYMKEEFNNDLPTTYLAYLDANNLYGWAMNQCMPFANFKWSKTNIDVTKIRMTRN